MERTPIDTCTVLFMGICVRGDMEVQVWNWYRIRPEVSMGDCVNREMERGVMTFSVIVVCLNAGVKLRDTIESIQRQTEQDYEIIIKDGVSTDEATVAYLGELEHRSRTDSRIRVYRGEKDSGIYDAMNQAVKYVNGDYIFFLNCGDHFYDDQVLSRVREQIGKHVGKAAYIFYGNICERLTGTMVQSNPVIDDFACYRNLPCHQACFYAAGLFRDGGFDTKYRVRADYEHFLRCYYRSGAKPVYIPVTVALYEGGGFSETRENKRRSNQEHKEIVMKYMPAGRVFRYRMLMILTLAPLRTWIAENPHTAGGYQRIKKKIYRWCR